MKEKNKFKPNETIQMEELDGLLPVLETEYIIPKWLFRSTPMIESERIEF